MNAPIVLANHGTALHLYAEFYGGRDAQVTIVSRPDQPGPIRPGADQPLFIAADIGDPDTQNAWLQRVYTYRMRWPHVPIALVCGNHPAEQASAYTAGATAVFPRIAAPEQVFTHTAAIQVDPVLSERKTQIAMSFSRGASNAAAGEELFISAETVKSHAAEMYRRYNVNSRPALVHAVFADGALPYPPSSASADRFPLTTIERATVSAVARAGSYEAAAESLNRSALTVKTHARNIRARHGWSVEEAVAQMWRWGAAA